MPPEEPIEEPIEEPGEDVMSLQTHIYVSGTEYVGIMGISNGYWVAYERGDYGKVLRLVCPDTPPL